MSAARKINTLLEQLYTLDELNKSGKRIEDQSFQNIKKIWINLDRFEDRRAWTEKQIKFWDIKNCERFEGVDFKEIDKINEGIVKGIKYINNYKNFTKKTLAITLSHLLAIKESYDQGLDKVMIMEDDICFDLVPHWNVTIEDIIKDLDPDGEIILLTWVKYDDIKKINSGLNMYDSNHPVLTSATCYIVTRKGMEKVNSFFKENKTLIFPNELSNYSQCVIDFAFWRIFKTYYHYPRLFLLETFKFFSTKQEKKINKLKYICNNDYMRQNILKEFLDAFNSL